MRVQEDASLALESIKGLIKYNPSERKSAEEMLNSPMLREEQNTAAEAYDIYDDLENEKIPGLCIVITQSKYHNVI